jgi:OOP family OmpA-OmpF porin
MNRLSQVQTTILSVLLLMPLGAYAEKGFFVGGSIGSAELSDDFDGLNIDTDATSFRIVGGWRFNDYFAVEGGYHDFGDFEQQVDINGTPATANLSADGFTLGVGGNLPLGERFSLLGRFGMFFWDGNAEINNVSQATPEDSNPYFGAGVGYAVTESLLISGDLTRYELEDANSNVFSIGFQYRFGVK